MNGWTFSLLSPTALGLALGLAGLVTFALYLLRLRRRVVVVPFIGLWESLILDKKAAALRTSLRRWLSFLLSLLLIFALILAFSDPRSPRERRGRHMVVLLDVGLHMATGDAGGRSCLDVAKARVEGFFASLGPGDQMLLVQVGARPRPLEAFTSDRSRLKTALAGVEALDVTPDLDAALLLARDASLGRTAPEIILVSNQAAERGFKGAVLDGLPPLRFSSVAAQCAAPTPAAEGEDTKILAFAARRYPLTPDRFEVLLRVASDAKETVPVEMTIQAVTVEGEPGPVLEVVHKDLLPGAGETVTFANLGQVDRGLLAHVTRRDKKTEPNSRNNTARAVLSKRLPVRVLVVGPVDTFLEAALLIEESLMVKQIAVGSYPPAEEFDVTIFNGVAPPRSARTGAALYLGVPQKGTFSFPLAKSQDLSSFGFDTWDTRSRVFQFVDPYDVQVLSGSAFTPEAADVVLARSEGRPILVRGQREPGPFIALGFRPEDSDFVLRAVWPLFVINVIDDLYPRGRGDTLSTGSVDTDFRIPVDDVTAKSATLLGPLGLDGPQKSRTVPVVDGQALVYSERAGFFDLVTKSGATRIAIAPQVERDAPVMAPAPASKQGKTLGPYAVTEPEGMQARSNFDPWFWLVVGVLVISYLEWWSYHRRLTV